MNDASALKMLNASGSELKAFSNDEWRNLILYLVERLQSYFGGRIATEPLGNACIGDDIGFCIDIWSVSEAPDTPLNWKGILGATTVDDKLHVSLTVFFYSGDKRLIARQGECGNDGRGGKEFAEYVLESTTDSERHWRLLDWFDDIYGEYDSF